MDSPPSPDHESARLAALEALAVPEQPVDPALERLTTLARDLFEVPTALVTLLERRRLRFIAAQGWTRRDLPSEGTFCSHAIADGDTLVVEDALADPRFAGAPLVSGAPGIRFYAGAPLRPDGEAVGTLCLIDSRPRSLSARERHLLEQLAAQAEVLLTQHALRQRQRRQQEELELSTRRMAAVLEESAAGIIRIDRHGTMRDINPFALRLLGYPRHELVGENIKALMHDGEASRHDGYLSRYLAGEAPRIIGQGREVVARHRDGRRVPVHLAVSAIRGGDGEVDEFIGILTDLSEIHEARRAAQRERRLLGAIIDGSREPIYARSSGGRYLAANRACRELLGLDALEGEPPPLSVLLPHALAAEIESAEREVLRLGRPRQLVLGEVKGRHLELSLSPLGNLEEGVRGVVGVVHDTTEARRQSNLLRVLHQGITDYQALMSGHRLWEFLMEALRELTDSDYALIGEVVEAEGAPALKLHAITDLSWSEESRRLMERLRSGDMMLTNPDSLLGRVFAHGEVVMTEDLAGQPGRGGFPPGHPSLRNYLGVPIHDGQSVIGMFAIANGRRRYDRALLEWLKPFTSTCALLINLHRGLAERARATEALAQARDQAERASRAKSEFLSSMSHELRTPLNAVLGYAQLLANSRQQPLNERQARQVAQIERSGQHLLALINDVLDLARIEAGKLSLSLERVRLDELVGDALMSVQTSAADAGVTLIATEISALPEVRADYTRLKQVLLNLLSNAIKYNRRGGRVEVAVSGESARVWVSVRDTGLGIAQEHQSALFEPFQRLGAEHGAIEGTGIGLSITRQLVEAMSGEIWVESRLGEGSVFHVALPLAEAGPAPEAAAGDTAPIGGQGPAASCRVLYVEDNPANRQLMHEVFADLEGAELITAGCAEEALERLGREVPDLLLLDIHLPGMDGHALLARLRREPQWSSLPVLAVTASAMPSDIRRGRLAGFDGYLTKPLDLERLRRVLNEYLPIEGESHA